MKGQLPARMRWAPFDQAWWNERAVGIMFRYLPHVRELRPMSNSYRVPGTKDFAEASRSEKSMPPVTRIRPQSRVCTMTLAVDVTNPLPLVYGAAETT